LLPFQIKRHRAVAVRLRRRCSVHLLREQARANNSFFSGIPPGGSGILGEN
jgi:hypothetical protein